MTFKVQLAVQMQLRFRIVQNIGHRTKHPWVTKCDREHQVKSQGQGGRVV